MRIRSSAALFVIRKLLQQFFRRQPEPLNGCVNPRPFFRQKFLPFPFSNRSRAPALMNMPQPPPAFDQFLVDKFLIALQNRERIDAIFSRDSAHGGQRIAFLEHAVKDHRDDAVAKLAVNRLTVVPLTVHHVIQMSLLRACSRYFTRCRSK